MAAELKGLRDLLKRFMSGRMFWGKPNRDGTPNSKAQDEITSLKDSIAQEEASLKHREKSDDA